MPEKSWCFGEARRPYTMRLTPGEGRAETLLICRWRTYRQILPYKCSTKPKSAFRYVTAHPPEGTEQEMGFTKIHLCSDWHLMISFAHRVCSHAHSRKRNWEQIYVHLDSPITPHSPELQPREVDRSLGCQKLTGKQWDEKGQPSSLPHCCCCSTWNLSIRYTPFWTCSLTTVF